MFNVWYCTTTSVDSCRMRQFHTRARKQDDPRRQRSSAAIHINQLPKLCVKISILMHRRMWVRSLSTRLASVTFAEDKMLIFLILRKNAKRTVKEKKGFYVLFKSWWNQLSLSHESNNKDEKSKTKEKPISNYVQVSPTALSRQTSIT